MRHVFQCVTKTGVGCEPNGREGAEILEDVQIHGDAGGEVGAAGELHATLPYAQPANGI